MGSLCLILPGSLCNAALKPFDRFGGLACKGRPEEGSDGEAEVANLGQATLRNLPLRQQLPCRLKNIHINIQRTETGLINGSSSS